MSLDDAKEIKLLRLALHPDTQRNEAVAALIRLRSIVIKEGIDYVMDKLNSQSTTESSDSKFNIKIPVGPFTGMTLKEVVQTDVGRDWLGTISNNPIYPVALRVAAHAILAVFDKDEN